MKKKEINKIAICLYILIAILMINTFCVIVLISRIKDSNVTSDTPVNEPSSDYDVSMFSTKTPAEITKMIKNGEKFVIYIGQKTCSYCKKMLPTMQKAQTAFGYKTIYLNIAAVDTTSSDYKTMAALLDVIKTANGETKKFGEFAVTPMTAVISDGKMLDGMIGYDSYDNYISFLDKIGFIKK